MARCRCHSGKQEKRCCGPLHAGKAAPRPVALMRSRYAAYAKGLVRYVMDTTHPDSPHRTLDPTAWATDLQAFSRRTTFERLQILDAPEPDGDEAFVTFRATLTQDGRDVGFTERSRFLRVDGRWLYVDGEAG